MQKKKIIKQIAKNLDLDEKQVSYIYNYYWLFIRNTIKKETINSELVEGSEFNLSFNIPSFGKLYYKNKKNKDKKL